MGVTGAIAVGAGVSLLNSQSQMRQANYNQAVANANASMLDQQAIRRQAQADEEAVNFKKQVKRTVGTQRAALAAQGVDVNDGSAMEIQTETEILGAQDAVRIQTNGYLEALGIKTQAQNMRQQAAMQVDTVKENMATSMLAGGIQGYMSSGGYKSGAPKAPSTAATAGPDLTRVGVANAYAQYGNLA